ncbi:MAG: apolipoprotein N-acyltransferase [Spirochaetes bacterium]|nr:apolipoprotein N-acyltransferase [Spirochaetota bacterium]
MQVLLQALFSAFLFALALPNDIFLKGFWPLGFIALVPLYQALKMSKSFRQAALCGAIFGLVSHALTSYWLFFFRGFAFWTLGTTTIAYGVIYAAVACYAYFVLGETPDSYRPFIFALGWVSLEFLKSVGFLGYPWGLLAYSLSSQPLLLQTADLTGTYGISFILAFISATLAEGRGIEGVKTKILRGWSPTLMMRQVLVAGLLAFLTLGYGFLRLNQDIPVKKSFRAALVQQNTNPWISGELTALASNISLGRKALSESSQNDEIACDLVIFSETSLRRPYKEFTAWFAKNPAGDPLSAFLADSKAFLLTGAPIILDWESYAATNSTILISPKGEFLGSYAKIHPVPFAEAIPFWEYAWFRKFMQEVIGLDSGWVMGSERKVFHMPIAGGKDSIAFSTPICFEDAFAGLCRRYILDGAELLINLTNDSWSERESAQMQHWAIARFRAIENRRTLVRSTNAGVSCIIDAKGRNLVIFPQFVPTSAVVDIPVYAEKTPTLYTRFGDWFAVLALSLFVLGFIIDGVKAIRKRRRNSEA